MKEMPISKQQPISNSFILISQILKKTFLFQLPLSVCPLSIETDDTIEI